MNSFPSYGWFFDRPKKKAATRTIPVRAASGPTRLTAPPWLAPDTDKHALAALRRCCWRRDIVFTEDHASAVCRICGTIMPAEWGEG